MQITTDFPSTAASHPGTRIADMIEAMFLQEMLKTSGIEKSGGTAQGGIGEEQFSSFLTEEYARILAGRIDLHLPVRAAA